VLRDADKREPTSRYTEPPVDCDNVISFEDALTQERELLANVGEHNFGAQFLVWRTERALIVPCGMPNRAFFGEAVSALNQQGWPVYERDTGGDVTPQMPGVINVSLAFRTEKSTRSIQQSYHRLIEPIATFLRVEMGLDTTVASVPGSFCDGAYNIVAGSRKLGGTAQRWRLHRDNDETCSVLAHVAILCSVDLEPLMATINEFYARCAIAKTVDVDKHVTLEEALGTGCPRTSEIAARIADYLSSRRL